MHCNGRDTARQAMGKLTLMACWVATDLPSKWPRNTIWSRGLRSLTRQLERNGVSAHAFTEQLPK